MMVMKSDRNIWGSENSYTLFDKDEIEVFHSGQWRPGCVHWDQHFQVHIISLYPSKDKEDEAILVLSKELQIRLPGETEQIKIRLIGEVPDDWVKCEICGSSMPLKHAYKNKVDIGWLCYRCWEDGGQ